MKKVIKTLTAIILASQIVTYFEGFYSMFSLVIVGHLDLDLESSGATIHAIGLIFEYRSCIFQNKQYAWVIFGKQL